ncbi:MAG: hypothetical protein ABWZ43_07940 [Solirubrobacterales bacterium]
MARAKRNEKSGQCGVLRPFASMYQYPIERLIAHADWLLARLGP